MTGPYRNRKDRLNRDGKRPIFIHDEKIENGIDLYLVECRNPKVSWHWRPRNKIWGWRRLYDEFLFSKRERQQVYVNSNNIDVIETSLPRIHRNHIVSSCIDEKFYYENHNRSLPKRYDYDSYKDKDHDDYYNCDYTDRDDPKYFTTRQPQFPILYHSDHSGRSSSSSSSSYKSEHQFHYHAWGAKGYEEPSLTITRVRKQYSSNHTSYNPSPPPPHLRHNHNLDQDFNGYYSPWEDKHEFEIALNKLDQYYQDLFYSKHHESL